MPFRTKICGITNVPDAECLATVGVDAIGLNFFEKSKRFVEVGEAAIIAAALPPEVLRVGVFVNASIESIRDTVERVGLDFVQLHGDEPPEFLTELTDVRVIRAFRCRDGLDEVAEYLARCRHKPHAVLLDAYDPNEYGGTGKQLHWPDLRNAAAVIGTLPPDSGRRTDAGKRCPSDRRGPAIRRGYRQRSRIRRSPAEGSPARTGICGRRQGRFHGSGLTLIASGQGVRGSIASG